MFRILITPQGRLHSVEWEVLMVVRSCRPKCETLVLTDSQSPTSPHLSLRKALLTPDKLPVPILPTPKGWKAWLARAHVVVSNFLRVITRLNSAARARWTDSRHHSMPMNQPWRTSALARQFWRNLENPVKTFAHKLQFCKSASPSYTSFKYWWFGNSTDFDVMQCDRLRRRTSSCLS